MSIKFTGLDKLQKDLGDFQRAMRALDGQIVALKYDPSDPASVSAAIRKMEQSVDDKARPYRGNSLVDNVAKSLKDTFREAIRKRARQQQASAGRA